MLCKQWFDLLTSWLLIFYLHAREVVSGLVTSKYRIETESFLSTWTVLFGMAFLFPMNLNYFIFWSFHKVRYDDGFGSF